MATRISLAAAAAVLFLGSWVALHFGFYTENPVEDTAVYQRYGEAMAEGAVPYRDFRPEYPPGAMPVFALPALVGEDYEQAFGWLMAACGVALVILTAAALAALRAGRVRTGAVLAFAGLWPLALGPVVLTRFDLWPAALLAGGLAAFLAGRDRLGAGVFGAAVAAKLFPAVLAPLLAAWLWRRRGRREALVCGAICAGVVLAAFLPFAVLGPEGLASSLGRQLSRPLQIESLGAAVLVSLHHVAGLDVEMAAGHGSQNIAGALGDAVGAASTAVQLAVLGVIWVAFARGEQSRERLLRFAALALVAFVALGKVLSPQFLVWLVPVVPLVGLPGAAVLGAALLLTQSWFPYSYWDYARTFDGTVTALVLARDLVLLGLLLLLTRRELGWPRRPWPDRPPRTPPARPRS
ncbi:MAG: DUF2029 domain-containing protein [Thermoleophilia bacterium]|nr:DUF2029 domain-containing protein [Thermoleophilia bacterium]